MNHIEFQCLLKGLGISLRGSELDALMSRFDADSDGSIDMHEFFAYMESEKVLLSSDLPLEADHSQNSSSSSSNNIITKGKLQIPQHRRSTRTRPSSSSPPLASSGSKQHSHHHKGWGEQDQGQTYDPPPPYFRSNRDRSPAPQISSTIRTKGGTGVGIDRNSLRSEYRGRDRNDDVGRNDYDDNGKASRYNSRYRNRERESERDRNSEREGEEDRYANHVRTEEEIVGRQWHSTHRHNSDNSSSHLQIRNKDAVSSADSTWAARMLHAQELIERRLGRSYY